MHQFASILLAGPVVGGHALVHGFEEQTMSVLTARDCTKLQEPVVTLQMLI